MRALGKQAHHAKTPQIIGRFGSGAAPPADADHARHYTTVLLLQKVQAVLPLSESGTLIGTLPHPSVTPISTATTPPLTPTPWGVLSYAPAVNYPVGVSPYGVGVGNFNVSVLLGTGTDSFGAPTSYATDTGTRGLAVRDFNRGN